ncbi:dTDP-4-amino-4,6-dideoxyglucose formyltransferase [Hymenobacter sp. BT175]|uniref:dTDP-4-amino-4,6-dideoxyglucose formyltransferase n=1 Tax=Hymenobacter translucens TaxID=2886507 RepID=UPI001D0E032A|nr:dTDP-4-amino-4,6-dideoxyglucose formyltransferase [Hymenobacter translucens]MCC2547911.1 dTDP-4-amino-4,6-dideoxyglucose formyltransferase [Hymenobacter translucens]
MLPASNVLVITDNVYLAQEFRKLVAQKSELSQVSFTYCCSPASQAAMEPFGITPVVVKTEWPRLVQEYSLVISAHCKQLFPADMVQQVRCINIHPGLNPYNRGWFPQVFSILNKLPLGATIHEIDAELDHGAIIVQQPVPVYAHDTSLTAYNRVQAAELTLLDRSLVDLVANTYATSQPKQEGNLNLKKDFNKLLHLDLKETLTMGQAIDRLRALTHGTYKNAYFLDENGRKIYVNLVLEQEPHAG